jgi:hypothetical protein
MHSGSNAQEDSCIGKLGFRPRDWRTNRHHRACERTKQRSAWWSRDGWPLTHRASKGGPGGRLVAAARDSPSLQDLCAQASSAKAHTDECFDVWRVEARPPSFNFSFLFPFPNFWPCAFLPFYLCFPVIFWKQENGGTVRLCPSLWKTATVSVYYFAHAGSRLFIISITKLFLDFYIPSSQMPVKD